MKIPVINIVSLIASIFILKLNAQDHAVRLVGDRNANFQGRVEVRLEGSWGRVCGVKWDIQDANIVCRHLGYEGAAVDPKYLTFGSGKGQIWMDNVQCRGNESSLFECKHDRWGGFRCESPEEARTVCKPAARLVEGESAGEGLVQLYYNNTWGWVCADHWDKHAADVVCRMMGFNRSSLTSWRSVKNEQLHDLIWLNNLQCTGNEKSLFSCPRDDLGSNNRACKRKVSVRCDDSKEVRLVGGGSVASQGRVEVFHNGVWGTICNCYYWYRNLGMAEANVVCRELGYDGAMVVPSFAVFGPGKGVTWMNRLRCNGDEKSIKACGHAGWGVESCNRHYLVHASVICQPLVRLVGNQLGVEGLVQVYYKSTWGWVGTDHWDKLDGDVVCREMGFSKSLSLIKDASIGTYDYDGKQSQTTWMNNLQCIGNESSLLSCVNDGWRPHQNVHKRMAGVVCSHQKVQLVDGGSIESHGRIEVFLNGTWAGVCRSSRSGSYNRQDVEVVCRQLGYEGAEQIQYSTPHESEVRITWLKNVQCAGNESSLLDCKHSGSVWFGSSCSSSYVATAVCTPAVRLVHGHSVNEGVVQVYYNNTWGWICDQKWDKKDADVVCRMLGFEESSFAVYRSTFCGQNRGVTWLSNVQCSGNERSLFSCIHDGWKNHHCTGRCAISRKAGVVCKDPKVRLVGGKSSFEGRVEVLYAGIWGNVKRSSSGYTVHDKNSAIVICRQLGFEGGAPETQFKFGRAARNTWMNDLRCSGNERSIIECKHTREDGYYGVLEVRCTPAVRLVNGISAMEGLVQVYRNKTWGAVCDDHWGKRDADVICRTMGYNGSTTVLPKRTNISSQHEVAWRSNIQCTGNETTLFSCDHGEWTLGKCENGEQAFVACKRLEVRLVDGKHRWEGTVEVLYRGIWGSVCDNGWDIRDANTVCRQLSFKGAVAAPRRSAFGSHYRTRWMDQVQCKGNESTLSDCLHNGLGVDYCSSYSLASVVCHRQDVPVSTVSTIRMQYCSSSPFVCKKGTNCTLICLMPGTRAVEYHWTKDGKSINSDHVIISNNVLIVTPQAKKDYGEFECKAFYSASNASSCMITLTEMKDEDEDEEGGGEIPFLAITITLSCALLMVIVVTSWLIRWRRRLNFKALISRSIEQETIQNPRAPDNAATLDLHVRTTQARGHLEHEYQPLRHRKNDFPKYENVKYFFNKQEQKDDVYEEIDLGPHAGYHRET